MLTVLGHCFQVVCERKDVFASASAIARILPLFTAKSSANTTKRTLTVEYLLVDGSEPLNAEDIGCLDALAYGIRLAAKIVDIPCADMHTDAFLEVRYLFIYGVASDKHTCDTSRITLESLAFCVKLQDSLTGNAVSHKCNSPNLIFFLTVHLASFSGR